MTEVGTMTGLFNQVTAERDRARDLAARLEEEVVRLRAELAALGWTEAEE